MQINCEVAGTLFRNSKWVFDRKIFLEAEPDNKFDKLAVKVLFGSTMLHVGYLPKNSEAQKAFHLKIPIKAEIARYSYSSVDGLTNLLLNLNIMAKNVKLRDIINVPVRCKYMSGFEVWKTAYGKAEEIGFRIGKLLDKTKDVTSPGNFVSAVIAKGMKRSELVWQPTNYSQQYFQNSFDWGFEDINTGEIIYTNLTWLQNRSLQEAIGVEIPAEGFIITPFAQDQTIGFRVDKTPPLVAQPAPVAPVAPPQVVPQPVQPQLPAAIVPTIIPAQTPVAKVVQQVATQPVQSPLPAALAPTPVAVGIVQDTLPPPEQGEEIRIDDLPF